MSGSDVATVVSTSGHPEDETEDVRRRGEPRRKNTDYWRSSDPAKYPRRALTEKPSPRTRTSIFR